MKHQTPELVKFKKLQRRLGFTKKRDTIGLLESLWHLTQREAKRGDIGRLDNETIAIECEWDGDPGELIEALLATGWIDEHDEFRLVIHDWASHAPRYIHGVVSKIGGFIKPPNGQSPTTVGDSSRPLQSMTVSSFDRDCSGSPAGAREPNLTKPNPPPTPSKQNGDSDSLPEVEHVGEGDSGSDWEKLESAFHGVGVSQAHKPVAHCRRIGLAAHQARAVGKWFRDKHPQATGGETCEFFMALTKSKAIGILKKMERGP